MPDEIRHSRIKFLNRMVMKIDIGKNPNAVYLLWYIDDTFIIWSHQTEIFQNFLIRQQLFILAGCTRRLGHLGCRKLTQTNNQIPSCLFFAYKTVQTEMDHSKLILQSNGYLDNQDIIKFVLNLLILKVMKKNLVL